MFKYHKKRKLINNKDKYLTAPFAPLIASLASVEVSNWTNPKHFDSPVSLSRTTVAKKIFNKDICHILPSI